MNSKFDECINRYHTNSAKYDEMGRKYGSDIYQCAVADMDYKSPKAIINSMYQVIERGVFGYTILPEKYEQLVSDWMLRKYNTKIEKDWVIFSPRINMAMNMIIETFTTKENSAIVFTPAYPAFVNAVCKYGRVLIESPLKKIQSTWTIDLEVLESQVTDATKILFLCNPHNPVGRVWSKEELCAIGAFCIKHQLLIVSDDIHADFVRGHIPYRPIWDVVPQVKEQTIILNSCTKTFNVPGIILSNMIIPNSETREIIKGTIDKWGLHNPNIFAASIMKAAYTQCDKWLEDVNRYITSNMEEIKQFIDCNMPKFQAYIPEGTYMMWIDYRLCNVSEEHIKEVFLIKGKIAVYWGSHFGKEGEGFFRLNVATTKTNIKEMLKRLYNAYQSVG